ncbi:hydroxyacylglutathione hydrolase [Haladaptatus litoreus]|uniref:Hydroxyacylglutathione hydrolase n=1 Tax=Haladaptatus litoreus TaxID=553468 RepID=A0A1N7DX72_9EURY|nr:hydroxyacylglutathione hydrolase [Haladaptatus litoreus]
MTLTVNRIRLGNTEFEGENSVYVLGTAADEQTTLIDTSVRTPETLDALRSGLAEHGQSLADVEQVVLTHWHPDHAGLAGTVQEESGATVFVHEADAALVAQEDEAWDVFEARQRTLLREWGLPKPIQKAVLATAEKVGRLDGPAPTIERISAGDELDCATGLETVHLPGHTEGLVGFAFDGNAGRELFSGDALLPDITPNVGGADVRLDNPLAAYLDTLSHFIDSDYDRAWPGHGDVMETPAERAREIRNHHRERAENILDVLADHGSADPWSVAGHLFGELDGIHVLHGPGEAYAHLEHLAESGAVRRVENEYELVEHPDLDALFGDAVAVRQ